MLEQQQSQLVAGLQESYRRLQAAQLWPGGPLQESDGHALTHDILARLDILQPRSDGEIDVFEEAPERLQQRLLAHGHGSHQTHRAGSVSSDSDSSHARGHSRSKSYTPASATVNPQKSQFRQSFAFDAATSSPLNQSPVSRPMKLHLPSKPTHLHMQAPVHDNLQAMEQEAIFTDWSGLGFDGNAPELVGPGPEFTMPMQTMQGGGMQGGFGDWQGFDSNMHYDAGLMSNYAIQPPNLNMAANLAEWSEPMEVDFSKFIQVAT